MEPEEGKVRSEAEAESGPETPRSGGSSVRDIIERTLALGLGAASLSMERIEAVVDDFVRRGQLSREEGREMVEDLTNRSREEARSVKERMDGSLQKTYGELGIATRNQLDDIEFRIRQLEHRVGLLEKQADEETKASGDS